MKSIKIFAINLVILVALVESISVLFFKREIRSLFYEYWQSPQSFGRGYPRYHFSVNSERGFDIAPNTATVISNKPEEINPYPVWGNKIGCFDDDLSISNRYKIYLAGDSVTWGYAPLEKKFGTILQNKLGLEVAACGVTHTGQAHQFQKFKDVSKKLGYFPDIVFVNVVRNDIDNDFSHPHSTIIEGYQVDNIKIYNSDNTPVVEEIERDVLRKKLLEKIDSDTNARLGNLDPRKYSASSILLWHSLVRPFTTKRAVKKLESCDTIIKVDNVARCFAVDVNEGYPINSYIAHNNREVINNWISHAKKNKYKLIFADVNTQSFNADENPSISNLKHRQAFCKYITSRGSDCYSFYEYLDSIGISNWHDVRWKRDGHLNLKGNELYSDFLLKIYKNSV